MSNSISSKQQQQQQYLVLQKWALIKHDHRTARATSIIGKADEPVAMVFESGGQLDGAAPLLHSAVQLRHVVHYEGHLDNNKTIKACSTRTTRR